jgi:CDP-diglyceride synthetase
MIYISQLLFLTLPVIVGGVLNMIFVNSTRLNVLNRPMDGGYVCSDGERLFGNNKTWKGFIGMIILTSMCMLFFEFVAKQFPVIAQFSLIDYNSFTFPANGLFYGAIWGFAYVLFELPNSYVKRRLNISPGKNAIGAKGIIFTVIDQADSVIGCVIVTPLFLTISIIDGVLLVVLCTLVHLIVNMMLYVAGLKQQAR